MLPKSDFIVVDTEGRETLHEIAVIDHQGNLIYKAFDREHLNHDEIRLNRKPLKQIILDFADIAKNKLIICHFADHDIKVLKNSFKKTGIGWKNFKFNCTFELAKQQFPNLASYSLAHLSRQLSLKVRNKYFIEQQAHTARYDTEFTYQLYRKIMNQKELQLIKNQPNPFGSTRVDNPFQSHPDLTSIYQEQFNTLKSIIADIKSDTNHQTKGAVVIGEPGSGKTHLMMRLAKELLEYNRLLFIRQPNNPDAVIYHTYSRILESLVEKVPHSEYTQIEHLLANSFVQLIRQDAINSSSQKEQYILETTEDNSLRIYYSLGTEGTQKKREYWQYIEKRTIDWWLNNYGAAGYSLEIIRGIIKFCSYSDPGYKRLVTRWLAADSLEESELEKIGLSNPNEEMSKEAFSLEAIAVLSKLSLLDEPLIIVFDQLEGLGLKHNERLLLSFGEAIKEIFTHVPNSLIILNLFPDRWQQFQQLFDGSIIDRVSQYQVILEKPSLPELKQILHYKAQSVGVNIETLFTTKELNNILHHSSIRAVLNRAYDYYRSKVNNITLPSSVTTVNTSPNQEETVIDRLQSLENQFAQLQQLFKNIAQAFGSFNLDNSQNNTATEKTLVSESLDKNNNNHVSSTNKNLESNKSILSIKIDPVKQRFIQYLATEKKQLEKQYDLLQIIDDSDDIGKLKAIAEAFNTIKAIEIDHLRLGKKRLPEHFVIRKKATNLCIGFLHTSGISFTTRIKNYNTLVISNKDIRFVLWRDSRQPKIQGKIGKEEIVKLKNAPKADFKIMEQEDRINFELVYKLIVDIQNRDLDIPLETALKMISDHLKNYWLIISLL